MQLVNASDPSRLYDGSDFVYRIDSISSTEVQATCIQNNETVLWTVGRKLHLYWDETKQEVLIKDDTKTIKACLLPDWLEAHEARLSVVTELAAYKSAQVYRQVANKVIEWTLYLLAEQACERDLIS